MVGEKHGNKHGNKHENKHGLVIFRRDLRIYDHTALNLALKECEKIYCIFIFTPEQIDKNKNEYFSENAYQFMCESIQDLDNELNNKLTLLYGDQYKIINELTKNPKLKITDLYTHIDFTPYAKKRDEEILGICNKNKIRCHLLEDYLLLPIGTILKNDNSYYKKYTPFMLKYKSQINKIKKPEATSDCVSEYFDKFMDDKFMNNKFMNEKIEKIQNDKQIVKIEDMIKKYKTNENISVHGGRKEGLIKFNKISEFKKYKETRDEMWKEDGTTRLSAYIKFGCFSIREIYYKIVNELGKESTLINELIWRDFYMNILNYNPQILQGHSFNKKYDKIHWNTNENQFKKWCNGNTGFPIVDAGMRQLNITGYMHNRSRMITSNFLTKILGISWKKGEKYFATKLVDYDPSSNNGGWQWSAGTGVDAMPYFRTFNPFLQSKNHDPNCIYIKRWISELKNIKSNDIHNWNITCKNIKSSYICPIINYDKNRIKKIMNMYKI